MRICEVTLAPRIGGAETVALELADQLEALGHDVDIVALDGADRFESNRLAGVEVLRRPRWARGDRLGRLGSLRRHLRSGRYDVVLAHTYLPNLYARVASATTAVRAPVVVTLQSAVDDFARPSDRRVEGALLPWTSAVVAVSAELRRQYEAYFPHARGRVWHIPNGVAKPSLGRPVDGTRPRHFACIGRICRQKDIETALRGFAAFASGVGETVQLTIAGPDSEPAYAAEMRRLADALPGRSITFSGPLDAPFDELRVDVLVHAAEHEGHPVTLMEAGARAVPIVCADVDAVSGAVDGHCSTFSPGNWEGLASTLDQVYRSWPAARSVAARAYASVPDSAATARAYEELFLELVGGRG
jgi:glycosyltransferase involved in cell wall biosynthesis